MMKLSYSKARIILPLVLLATILVFMGIYRLLDWPSSSELIQIVQECYVKYGYPVIFFGALIEGIFAVNWYFPGSLVIVLGISFSRQASLNPVSVIALVVIGFVIAVIFNYSLGRFGWYRLLLWLGLGPPLERAHNRVSKHGLPLIFLTYFHPHVSALVATSCGILRLPLRQFLVFSVLALIMWNTLLGIVVYRVGTAMVNLLNMWLFIPVIVLWILYNLIKSYLKSHRS